MKQYIITSFIFIIITVTANAVLCQRLPCGNVRIDTNALSKARQFRSTNASAARPAAVNYLIKVFFHIVRNDDTTNAPINAQQLKAEFATLLSHYTADNVCFINAGFDYVNNTFLNNFFNADNDPTGYFFNPYQVPGCINAFYMQRIGGNNTACSPPCGYGGIALGGIPGTYFLIGKSNIGDGVSVAHEMGHSLGLLHSFETAFGIEKIDGSNSTTAGDQITDTQADPFAYNGDTTCYAVSASGCLYTGSCADPAGAKNFTPPYYNLMSYWPSSCYPGQFLTNGQFTNVNSVLNTNAAVRNCIALSSTIILNAITVSSGSFMNIAISTYSTNGNVVFNGSVKAAIGAGTVFLNPGFRAAPTTGQVKIASRPCN